MHEFCRQTFELWKWQSIGKPLIILATGYWVMSSFLFRIQLVRLTIFPTNIKHNWINVLRRKYIASELLALNEFQNKNNIDETFYRHSIGMSSKTLHSFRSIVSNKCLYYNTVLHGRRVIKSWFYCCSITGISYTPKYLVKLLKSLISHQWFLKNLPFFVPIGSFGCFRVAFQSCQVISVETLWNFG